MLYQTRAALKMQDVKMTDQVARRENARRDRNQCYTRWVNALLYVFIDHWNLTHTHIVFIIMLIVISKLIQTSYKLYKNVCLLSMSSILISWSMLQNSNLQKCIQLSSWLMRASSTDDTTVGFHMRIKLISSSFSNRPERGRRSVHLYLRGICNFCVLLTCSLAV